MLCLTMLLAQVVITACDDQQRVAYEAELEARKLPTARYIVIADVAGRCRMGNGGSTMLVLERLYQEYQDELWRLRVLILHAGGYSQRTPQHSLSGKLFAALPFSLPYSSGTYSMLEMCIRQFAPLAEFAPPGVDWRHLCSSVVFDSKTLFYHHLI